MPPEIEEGAPANTQTSVASAAAAQTADLKPGDAGYVAPALKPGDAGYVAPQGELKPGDAGYVAPEAKPTAADARAFLLEKGGKKEDIDKMSDADALKAHGDAKKAESEAPLTYKEFTTPEGMELDKELIGKYSGILGKYKVPQEAAQELLDLHTAQLKELAAMPMQQWKELQADWVGQIKKDPELGGIKFDESTAGIAHAIDSIGGKEAPALRTALDITGAGNHPEICRFISRIGKMLKEGGIVQGENGGKPNPKNPAQILYGKKD